MRIFKIFIAGWAIAFAAALLLFLVILWIAGPNTAEGVWGPIPLSFLFVVGLILAKRYLRT
jgi:hypothetical protein